MKKMGLFLGEFFVTGFFGSIPLHCSIIYLESSSAILLASRIWWDPFYEMDFFFFLTSTSFGTRYIKPKTFHSLSFLIGANKKSSRIQVIIMEPPRGTLSAALVLLFLVMATRTCASLHELILMSSSMFDALVSNIFVYD
jgi:hypothetical protein